MSFVDYDIETIQKDNEKLREIIKEMMVSGSIIYKHHFSCNEAAGCELVDDIAGVKLTDMVKDNEQDE